jgi:hypothetical protein
MFGADTLKRCAQVIGWQEKRGRGWFGCDGFHR